MRNPAEAIPSSLDGRTEREAAGVEEESRSTERGALNDLGELTDGASLEPRAADELRSILVGRVVREAELLSRTLLVERGALTDGVESESLPGLTLRSLLEGLADRVVDDASARFSIVRGALTLGLSLLPLPVLRSGTTLRPLLNGRADREVPASLLFSIERGAPTLGAELLCRVRSRSGATVRPLPADGLSGMDGVESRSIERGALTDGAAPDPRSTAVERPLLDGRTERELEVLSLFPTDRGALTVGADEPSVEAPRSEDSERSPLAGLAAQAVVRLPVLAAADSLFSTLRG